MHRQISQMGHVIAYISIQYENEVDNRPCRAVLSLEVSDPILRLLCSPSDWSLLFIQRFEEEAGCKTINQYSSGFFLPYETLKDYKILIVVWQTKTLPAYEILKQKS